MKLPQHTFSLFQGTLAAAHSLEKSCLHRQTARLKFSVVLFGCCVKSG